MTQYSSKRVLLLSVCCFFLALAFRLSDIESATIQPDELHWELRSKEFVTRLKSRNFTDLTTHLTHPGVLPAVAMGSAQMLASRFNETFNLKPFDPYYIDSLMASRLSNAIISSLIGPLILLGSYRFIGLAPAALASFLMSLDPHHIGLSRMAHLDSMLTIFVMATIFLFIAAVIEKSTAKKIAAGFFWGLSILTKPTAVTLLIGLAFYKPLRNYLLRHKKRYGEVSLFSFSDLAFIAIGHLVLALGYTRLWHHNSDYRLRLHIRSSLADFLYSLGIALQHNFAAIFAIAVIILLSAIVSWQKRDISSSLCRASAPLIFLISIFLLLLSLVPQVFENLARFWTWVFGLSGDKHRAYGEVWEPPTHGYFSLLLSEIPSLTVIGFFLGLGFLIGLCRSFCSRRKRERLAFYIFQLLLTLSWTSVLAISQKQAFRYIMPVIPCVYLISAYGLCSLFAASLLKLDRLHKFLFHRIHFKLLPMYCVLLVSFQGIRDLKWSPDYFLYFNAISGGLPAALKRLHSFPASGVSQALRFLEQNAKAWNGDKVAVTAGGDLQITKYAYSRLQSADKQRLSIEPPDDSLSADYLILFREFRHLYKNATWQQVITTVPIFSHKVHGVSLLDVYEIPPFDFSKPFSFNLTKAGHLTGGRSSIRKRDDALYATPQKHMRGFLMYGLRPKLLPGYYEANFSIMLPPEAEISSTLTPERYAVRLEFGHCQRIVTLGELSKTTPKDFFLGCEVEKPARAQLRVYWFGNIPLTITHVSVKKVFVS